MKSRKWEDWVVQHVADVVVGGFMVAILLVLGVFAVASDGAAINKASGCLAPYERIQHKNAAGVVQWEVYNRLNFCYDGHQSRLVDTTRKCTIFKSATVQQKSQLTWWTRWNGNDHGALHSYLYCRICDGPFSACHIYQSEIVGGATGWVRYP